MRMCFIYGPFSAAKARYDFSSIWDSPDGLTGSELSCFTYAREMVRRGHEVHLFASNMIGGQEEWDGVRLHSYDDLRKHLSGWDAAYSWNDPEPLRHIAPPALRACNLQINSFTHCQPDCGSFVDLWTSPSDSHLRTVAPAGPQPSKWAVVPNGCDPSLYEKVPRVPGRVVYASSPDRGLHWLLQEWPKIRRAVPHAELHIFYRFDSWVDHFTSLVHEPWMDHTYPEMMARAHYIKECVRRLDGHGLHVVKAVSRNRMIAEMSRAEVLAYPCDTASYTEGFSVTLMEACASGMLPISTDVDALGSIYGGAVPLVQAPVGERISEFSDLVVRGLTDAEWRRDVTGRTTELAKQYKWSVLADRLHATILRMKEIKG